MQQHFTGRAITLESAVDAAAHIVIVRLIEAGTPDVGAPGQAYYSHASAEVVSWLHGEPPPETRLKTVSFAYTVQSIPKDAGEQVPTVGQRYILFFSDSADGGAVRVSKILAADEKAVSEVESVLRRRSK